MTGDPAAAEAGCKMAAAMSREHSLRFWLAVTLFEHGRWLLGQGRADDAAPLLRGAREGFEGLSAAPWLERLDHLRDGAPAVAVTS